MVAAKGIECAKTERTISGRIVELKGANILSIGQFERGDIEKIFLVSDQMEPYAQRRKITRVLDGAILGSMFFEASTRTRTTFELAAERLSVYGF